MKNIKKFNDFINENYEDKTKEKIDTVRSWYSTTGKKISKFASIVGDLSRLNFKALVHSFKNKSGYDKLEKVFLELSLLKKVKNDDDSLSFADLKKYGFDAASLLQYLNDVDVIEYIKNDANVRKHLEQMDYLIQFLEEYDEWNQNNSAST